MFRLMRSNPGTTLASFLALMLGIGASTAIFSIVNGIVLKPLPVRDGGRLVRIYSVSSGSDMENVSMADFLDWRRQLRSFSGIALYGLTQVTSTGTATPERVIAGQADAAFFPVLGVEPLQGRGFMREEEHPGSQTEAILSWQFWQQHYAGRNVLGNKIYLDEKPFTIIGVLPRDFSAVSEGDVWLPLSFDLKADENQRGFHTYMAVGRLAQHSTLASVNRELAAVSARLAAEYPKQNEGLSARAVPLSDASSSGGETAIGGKIKPVLVLMLSAAGCILLIACVNVMNIELSRALSRQREIATRIAMGATTVQLLRQFSMESMVTSLAATAAAVLLAIATVRVFRSLPLPSVPRLDQVTVDWRVLLFSVTAGIGTAIAVAILPALRSSRISIAETLKATARSATDTAANQKTRMAFVAIQAALAAALLVESGLLIKSFVIALRMPPGLPVDHVLTMYLSLPSSRYNYRFPGHVGPFAQAVLDRVRALPGVQAAAMTTDLPFTTPAGGGGILTENHTSERQAWNDPIVYWTIVSPKYFHTMQIPILRGRDFDRASDSDVVIVNRAFVRRFFGQDNPVGKRVAPLETEVKWRQVIGVVPDFAQRSVEERTAPQIFLPVTHLDPPWLGLVIRTGGDPLRYIEPVRREVAKVDGSVAAFLPRTLEELLSRQFVWRKLQTWVVGGFALISLTLACLGVHAVVAYSVDRRFREMGLRAALGASRGAIMRLLVWQGSAPATFGTLLGLALGFAAARATSRLLFGVTTTDITIYASVAGILFVSAVLSSYLPSKRAADVEPWVALRDE